jgi:hypothetical protein
MEQVLAVFGRLADHRFVLGTTYAADADSPFSLWINCIWSRRLKNDRPQWKEPLFAGGESVSRDDFGSRLRAMPFKYPISTNNRAVEPPAQVASALGMAEGTASSALGSICEDSPSIRQARASVQAHFDRLEIDEETVDRVFALLGGRGGGDLTLSTLETRVLELAMENPDIESDPVVFWEFWLAALTR